MRIKKYLFLLSVFFIIGCQSIPNGLTGVTPFDSEKYLGQWYEIARIDFKFEENLNNTTATYSAKDNGKIKVVNEGYNYVKKEWKTANGKAKFRGSENIAELAVSFFGPFYAGYNVLLLEGDYEYALVGGQNTDFLWILSRKRWIPEDVKIKFISEAEKMGYDTTRLIWVEHNVKESAE